MAGTTPKNKVASIITRFDSTTSQQETNGSRKASSSAVSTPKLNQTPSVTTPNLSMTSNGLSMLFEVIKEFNARLADELDLKVGQQIQVISDDSEYNDGWYMGKNLDTGEVGLYPKTFTKIMPNQQAHNNGSSPYPKPSLLRSRSRRLNSPTSQQNSPITPSSQPYLPHVANNDSSLASSNDSLVVNKGFNTSNNRQSLLHTNTIRDIDDALAELNTIGNDLVPSQVETWTPEQVSSYFSSIGVEMESAGQFARHKITGSILLELELSHLKELDISSFGTRFEIFKAIEALKIESRNASKSTTSTSNTAGVTSTPVHSSLMPPHAVNRSENTAPLHGHERKRSQSMDDIKTFDSASPLHNAASRTERNPRADAQKRASYAFRAPNPSQESAPIPPQPTYISSSSSSTSSVPQQAAKDQPFVSPRKAPDPPVEAQQRLNSNFRFGGGSGSSTPNANDLSAQFTRLSTLPEKERQFSNTSRPTSSIYHSRSSSIPLASMSPTRGHKHTNSSAAAKDKHKRHSSVFSFISGGGSINVGNDPYKQSSPSSRRNSLVNLLSSPSKISLMKKKNEYDADESTPRGSTVGEEDEDDLTDLSPVNDDATPRRKKVGSPLKDKISSPYRRSVSAQVPSEGGAKMVGSEEAQQKRAISEASRMKSLRNASSTHLQSFTRSKTKTSAFKEGIQAVSPDKAIKTADHYGWMYKKGSLNFKKRYFTLHGTRLSYFQSLKDSHERGLIDIQAHRVLPTDSNDLKSMLASSTTAARYSFKLVPPAPGSRKGLTFTQPKVHFFAVSSKDEMRSWMAALMKATIDMDETVPVVSSYTSATISLKQAQALQQKSSERAMNMGNKPPTADDTVSSSDTNNTSYETPKLQQQARLSSKLSASRNESAEFDDYSNTLATSTNAEDENDSGGFDSPYLLASGLLSPKSPTSNHSDDFAHQTGVNSTLSKTNSVAGVHRTKTFGTNPVPMITNLENGTTSNSSAAAIAAANAASKKK